MRGRPPRVQCKGLAQRAATQIALFFEWRAITGVSNRLASADFSGSSWISPQFHGTSPGFVAARDGAVGRSPDGDSGLGGATAHGRSLAR